VGHWCRPPERLEDVVPEWWDTGTGRFDDGWLSNTFGAPGRRTGQGAAAPVRAAAGSGGDSGQVLALRCATLWVTAGTLEVAVDGVDIVVVRQPLQP